MARFIRDNDYDALIRNEITGILLENYNHDKMYKAEQMAISQIKNYLKGKYDIEQIFTGHDPLLDPDPRSHYIVMITIDCTLYHLYTSTAPDRIPEHRAQRYGDALEWLKDVSRGDVAADLPLLTDDDGEVSTSIRIKSKYTPSNHKY
ncbi:MAG: DUF1320 family protein [Bacteroidales bacterium]|nr:DUF1320 family protein [Bacteroidales bacterium]